MWTSFRERQTRPCLGCGTIRGYGRTRGRMAALGLRPPLLRGRASPLGCASRRDLQGKSPTLSRPSWREVQNGSFGYRAHARWRGGSRTRLRHNFLPRNPRLPRTVGLTRREHTHAITIAAKLGEQNGGPEVDSEAPLRLVRTTRLHHNPIKSPEG